MASLAGSFLVARRSLLDPNFRRTVVLLIQHDDSGAFGVVVNRPAEAEGLPFAVFAGGPCESPGLVMLHGHPEWAGPDQPARQVAPGIFLGDAASAARVGAAESKEGLRYRMYLGYAGWGPGQLEGELGADAWATAPASGELLFDVSSEDIWKLLLPPELPQPSRN